MKTLILLLLATAIIILSITTIFLNYNVLILNQRVSRQTKQITCLNQGQVYVGDNFCAEK